MTEFNEAARRTVAAGEAEARLAEQHRVQSARLRPHGNQGDRRYLAVALAVMAAVAVAFFVWAASAPPPREPGRPVPTQSVR